MWEIDRFELAYFDGLHNHWQMFGECPEISSGQRKGSYSYHRTLVQELLDEIRELFTKTLNNATPKAFTIKGKSSSLTKATIKLDNKEVSKLNSTIVTFSDTILKHLEEEGLSDASVGEIRGFFEGLKTHISQGNGNAFEHVFNKVNYIYDLISLLPIEKDWDTMGIPYTNLQVYSNHSICWKEVVFFLLDYKDGNEAEKSKKFLGYNVELEICGKVGNCTKGDFFNFCCNDLIVDTKVEQYKTYAIIVDSLQKAIYGTDKTFKIHIIAYPIFIFNSLHYLYIYVKSKNDNGCIKKLKEDWLKVHEALNWSSQKTIITYYMEQISSFTFQDRILYRIHNPHTYQINILDDKSIEDVFKETIACIFPTSGSQCTIDVSPGIEMSYSKPPWWKDNDQFVSQIKLVGRHQWKWLKFIADALGENIKHGSKAAMTAIIARNLSHNIGSHVLSRWIAALNELLIKGDEFKDSTNMWNSVVANLGLDTALSRVSEYYKKLESSKPLFRYIQHRMDFIATVATSVPSSEMTMDFKKDVIEPFTDKERNKVLLENIAASEGFDLTDCFVVKVPENCGRVSIPNGIIGTHAIYSIFENFIRNAAKHYKGNAAKGALPIGIELKIPDRVKLEGTAGNGKKSLNNKVKFPNNVLTIKKDGKDQTYMLTKGEQEQIKKCFSNGEDKQALERFFYIHERYIKLRIWDMREGSCSAIILEDLRGFLDNKGKKGRLIEKDGTINPDGWGIKEMVVSSNFLRKNSPEKLIGDLDEKEPSIMEIMCDDESNDIACKNDGKNCHRNGNYKDRLGIRLYLRRPKDMCIIGKNEVIIEKDKFEIEYSNIVKENKDKRLTEDIPHRLLFVDESKETHYEDDPMAPMRIMTYKENVNNGKAVDDEFYLEKYEEFIKKLGGYEKNGKLPKLCYAGKEFNVKNNNDRYICKIDNLIEENANNEIFIFYYHADKPNEENTVKLFLTNKKYFQPVSGGYVSVLSKLDNLPTEELYQRHFLLELIESALTKVLIIDERVSDLADKVAFHDLKVRDILGNMKIDCLNVDKDNITYDSLKGKLTEISAINNNCIAGRRLSNYRYHFLVIHQGILDKVKKNNGNQDDLIKMIDYRWMVIDSGRGVPKELKEFGDARFVETSVLLKMLEEYDKHGLVQTLFSLRRPLVNYKAPD